MSVFDHALLVGYSVLLGIYAVGTHDLNFVVVNIGAALLSGPVAIASKVVKKKRGQA